MGGIVSSSTKPYMSLAKTPGGGLGGGFLLGALSAGLGPLVQGIIGGIRAGKGKKEFDYQMANIPKLDLQQEFTNVSNELGSRAAGNMPAMGMYQQLGAESAARGYAAAEKGSISSVDYGGRVQAVNKSEFDYLRDLAIKNVQWKDEAEQQKLAQLNLLGQKKEDLWKYNVGRIWDIKTQMAGEKMGAGMQDVSGATNTLGQIVSSLVGTKYLSQVTQGLYPNNNNTALPAGLNTQPSGQSSNQLPDWLTLYLEQYQNK